MKKLSIFILVLVEKCSSLKCWSCEAKSHLECFIYGREKRCSGRDVSSENPCKFEHRVGYRFFAFFGRYAFKDFDSNLSHPNLKFQLLIFVLGKNSECIWV